MPPAWIGCVLASGLALSLVLYALVRRGAESARQVAARAAVQEQAERLQISLLRSMEVLHSIAAFQSAHGAIDRATFQRFVQPALLRQPELQALSWNPRVPAEERSAFEASFGLPGFHLTEQDGAGTLVPAAFRSEHVPVLFIEPAAGNATAVGFDLASNPERRRSLDQARLTGRPVATEPITLAQGPDRDPGLLVVLPVFSSEGSASRRVDGYAVAVFRVAALVAPAVEALRSRGLEASVRDAESGELLFAGGESVAATGAAGDAVPLEVAGRRWLLRYAPTSRFSMDATGFQAGWVLAAGLLLTFGATGYVYGGWRRTRQVAAANAALNAEIVVRQRAEAAAAAANAAKSDFLASMSHEIRTPLNAILGYTQLLQRDPDLPADQRHSLAGIGASGQHLLGLINEILDLSKIEAGRMELHPVDFDLAALGRNLAATFRLLCVQKRIGFRLQLGADAATRVRGDEGKLRQVLINLLGNAVKFTAAGEVFLRIEPLSDGRWRFEVIDTGLGIPAEEQAGIFQPFHQGSGARHQGGTGLGLAIAQRQVELLGGALELQSERGIGSRFHFTVSLPPATEDGTDGARRVRRLAEGFRVRALVVDDRRENREILGGFLRSVGCDVMEAADAAETFHALESFPADIVFLDLLMPGEDGLSIARRLAARPTSPGGARCPVVAHSASALDRHRDEAKAAGCVDFLPKPLRADRVFRCLEEHLGVVFDVADPAPDAGDEPGAWPDSLVLPAELTGRLLVAAELHSTTALKAALREVEVLGPDAARLAEHLRHLMRSYDMDAIQRVLSRVATAEQTS